MPIAQETLVCNMNNGCH